MKYFEVLDHNGVKIGETIYLTFSAAKASANRTAGRRRKMAEHRGSGIKIVEIDASAVWNGVRVVEWINF
jgi:hypothetical protein